MKNRWKSILADFFWTCVQGLSILFLLFLGLWLFAGTIFTWGVRG